MKLVVYSSQYANLILPITRRRKQCGMHIVLYQLCPRRIQPSPTDACCRHRLSSLQFLIHIELWGRGASTPAPALAVPECVLAQTNSRCVGLEDGVWQFSASRLSSHHLFHQFAAHNHGLMREGLARPTDELAFSVDELRCKTNPRHA